MDAFWTGVVAALVGAIVGALLTILFTWLFKVREDKKRKNLIWYVVRDQITTNQSISKKWKKYLEEELKLISEEKLSLESLPHFKVGFYNEIIFNLPKKLMKNPELLSDLRILSQTCDNLNNQDLGRQAYKSPLPVYNKLEVIKMYDEFMLKELDTVIEIINNNYDELIITLDEYKKELKKIS